MLTTYTDSSDKIKANTQLVIPFGSKCLNTEYRNLVCVLILVITEKPKV